MLPSLKISDNCPDFQNLKVNSVVALKIEFAFGESQSKSELTEALVKSIQTGRGTVTGVEWREVDCRTDVQEGQVGAGPRGLQELAL
jgi:flavin-binding protein dodecin